MKLLLVSGHEYQLFSGDESATALCTALPCKTYIQPKQAGAYNLLPAVTQHSTAQHVQKCEASIPWMCLTLPHVACSLVAQGTVCCSGHCALLRTRCTAQDTALLRTLCTAQDTVCFSGHCVLLRTLHCSGHCALLRTLHCSGHCALLRTLCTAQDTALLRTLCAAQDIVHCLGHCALLRTLCTAQDKMYCSGHCVLLLHMLPRYTSLIDDQPGPA